MARALIFFLGTHMAAMLKVEAFQWCRASGVNLI